MPVYDDDGIMVFVDGVARDITREIEEKEPLAHLDTAERIKGQRERLTREKFQGVLEMAGGVAHRMNQPLTIINNLLNEILSDLHPEDDYYHKMLKVQSQITELNKISKKIKGITKYEAIDYVGGIKIVDIDRSS